MSARSESKQLIRNMKESKPCVDCKQFYHYSQMQFDHVRGTKVYKINEMLKRYSLERVLDEIAKCDLVCANCHALRTWQRLMV